MYTLDFLQKAMGVFIDDLPKAEVLKKRKELELLLEEENDLLFSNQQKHSLSTIDDRHKNNFY